MQRRACLAWLIVGCMSAAAYAQPTVDAGEWFFQVNTTGNIVNILTSGQEEDHFSAIDLAMRVNDGVTGPLISSVDLVSASDLLMFDNNNGQLNGLPLPGRRVFEGAVTQEAKGDVGPNGIVARLFVDTTDVPLGDYPLLLDLDGELTTLAPWDGLGDPPAPRATLINGVIHVVDVPEPESIVMALFAAAGLCLVAIRRRREAA